MLGPRLALLPPVAALFSLALGVHAAAACPKFCAAPAPEVDTDQDGVLDVHECWWCAHGEGTPLWLDPVDPDSDGDGAPDPDDVYPGAPGPRGELDFAARCEDPFPAGVVHDPEFSEVSSRVAWITTDADPHLWVAEVVGGRFAHPVDVDTGVLGLLHNFHNGPEWLYTSAAGVDGAVVTYAKVDPSDALVKVRYAAFDGSAWQARWLGGTQPVRGFMPYGTVVRADPAPFVLLGEDLDPDPSTSDWWYSWCSFPSCADGPRPVWRGSFDPLDPMRIAELDRASAPLLVGVDHRGPEPHQIVVVDHQGVATPLTQGPPSKTGAWLWHDPASGRDLVLSTDMIYLPSTATGPGVIRIRTYPDGDPWQTIPVGPTDFPYILSLEPFVAASGRSYMVYVASKARTPFEPAASRVMIAEVSDQAVGGSGVDPRLTVRRLDAGEGDDQVWKDPEGFTDGTHDAVFVNDPHGGPGGVVDVVRCRTGTL